MNEENRTKLVPCPLCGGTKGYVLGEGSTHRWWSARCRDCDGEVAEARADRTTHHGAPRPDRWPAADVEWNAAGAHAQGLRDEVERLRGLMQAGECSPEDGHMNQEPLARRRAAGG